MMNDQASIRAEDLGASARLVQMFEDAHGRLPADPRDPDYTKGSIFVLHNCWHCSDGLKPCVVGNPRNCEYPHARND